MQAPLVKGVNAAPPGSPPFKKAQLVPPVAAVVTWTAVPAAITPFVAAGAAAPAAMVRAGNGVIARLDPVGQEEMNPAARVKTARMPRGVSKADGIAAAFEAVRMKV